ncbi:YlbD family protein [Geomicrobium sediminis]|uniref:Coat protein n=1 Tax=Geomicrobium sediminis TaxID=1347788 RepID=A0ABS2PJ77_9BACL|nr:YlbD family protein [Geomicrobium sediminis]MBM7635080.1 hypothetical protein [Geomicrobium sediminis]
MPDEHMDPSVIDFKAFVKNHPGLIQEVREGRRSWNGLYQDWSILGSDDQGWQAFARTTAAPTEQVGVGGNQKQEATSAEGRGAASNLQGLLDNNPTVASVVSKLGQMNVNELQGYLGQFSGVMNNVQQLMGQFQNTGAPVRSSTRDNPFSFRGF